MQEEVIHVSSLITEEMIEQAARKILALSEEEQRLTLRRMGRSWGKPMLCQAIFEKYMEIKYLTYVEWNSVFL